MEQKAEIGLAQQKFWRKLWMLFTNYSGTKIGPKWKPILYEGNAFKEEWNGDALSEGISL